MDPRNPRRPTDAQIASMFTYLPLIVTYATVFTAERTTGYLGMIAYLVAAEPTGRTDVLFFGAGLVNLLYLYQRGWRIDQ